MVNVMLSVDVVGETWCAGFKKRFQMPALLPVGSLLVIHGLFDLPLELYVEQYFWESTDDFVNVTMKRIGAAESETLDEWRKDFEAAGWTLDHPLN